MERNKMSNDVTLLQQQNEILQLKYQLMIEQAKKISKLDDSLFSKTNFEHYYKIAQQFAKSTLVPKQYIGKPEDIFIAMGMGYQLGFSVEQSLQDIAVINGRPCVWGDGLLAVILSHPEFEFIDEYQLYDGKGNVIGACCNIKRKGHPEHLETFTIDDAKKAKLWDKQGPWVQYSSRMLKMRARAFAVRDKFADALRGIKVAEEVMDYEETKIIEGRVSKKTNVTENMLNKLLEKKGIENDTKSIEENNEVDIQISNQRNKTQASENYQHHEMGELGEKKVKSDSKVDLSLITDELLDEVSSLLREKPMTAERMELSLKYLDAKDIESMNISQAKRFIKIINTPAKEN
jgi:RecT family